MKKHLLTTPLVLALLLTVAGSAAAQTLRPERTFYLTPRVGVTQYLGDNSTEVFDWGGEVAWVGGLEFGYQISTRFSLGGFGQYANYPVINPPTQVPEKTSNRLTLGLLARWTGMASEARVAPFLQFGLHGTTLGTDLALGPSAGLGLDIVINDRTSFIIDWLSHLATPDEAVDYVEGDGFASGFDLLNTLNLGIKFNFRSAFTPAQILALECPTSTVTAGQAVTFTATTNSDAATPPVRYSWNFGDGGSGEGTVATHTFNQPGTYTVTFNAQNNGQPATRTCPVTVRAAPVAAAIVTATANPMRFQVCEDQTVQFSANARGDEPVTYTWDFGDGQTGSGANTSHVYSEEGTYTVRLTATNAQGSDTRTLTVTAEPCQSGVCFEVTEMNSVFFDRNSSTLTAEGRAALQENLQILRECPNLCARIEGFAGPDERNPQRLSEDRARAVAQFYSDNGIAASRLTTVGRGAAGGATTSKKEGTAQLRRADTIPMQCTDMN